MSLHTLQVALTRALVAAKSESDDDDLADAMREVFTAWTAHLKVFTADNVLKALSAADGVLDALSSDDEPTDEHEAPLTRHDPTGDLDDETPTIADEPLPALAHRAGRAEDIAKMSRVRAALAGIDPGELVAALAACYGTTGPMSMGFSAYPDRNAERMLPGALRPTPTALSTFAEVPGDDLYLTSKMPPLQAELNAVLELAREEGEKKALIAVLTQGFSNTALERAHKALVRAVAHDSRLQAQVAHYGPEAAASWIDRKATQGIVSFAFAAWCGAMDARPMLERLRAFLGDELGFFRGLRAKHGDEKWSHSIHLHEGMQVRNWLRAQPELVTLQRDDHWLDDNWGQIVNAALDGHQHVTIDDIVKTFPFPSPEESDDEAEAAEDMTSPSKPRIVAWTCSKCGYHMDRHLQVCPRCDYTVFRAVWDPPETLAKSDKLAKSDESPPAREVATAESDAERRAKDEAATPRGRTAPQPPDAASEWTAETTSERPPVATCDACGCEGTLDEEVGMATGQPVLSWVSGDGQWCSACIAALLSETPGPSGGFLIFDTGDSTYHTGGGHWSVIRDDAFIYNTEADARNGLDDVDQDEIMRDRLTIVPRRVRRSR